MVLWLVLIGIVGLIVGGIWHERKLRSQEQVKKQESEEVAQQRRQLEGQLLNMRAGERAALGEQAFGRLEAGTDVELGYEDLLRLLPMSPPDEQWQWLGKVCDLVNERYSGRPLPHPQPYELMLMLHLLSARPEGFRRQVAKSDCLRLQQLKLPGLQMAGLNLRGADLQHCNLATARLEKLDLFAGSCKEVSFADARLSHANLTGARLESIDFSGADLRQAELITAELIDCNFRGADLSSASLRGVRMNGCDLGGANLTGVSGLSFKQMLGCRIDGETRLPQNLQARRDELLARGHEHTDAQCN